MAKKSRFQVEQAEKMKQKLRIGLEGPSGSGKTYSALLIATGLAEKTGDQICLIDTENRSASLYADDFDFKTIPFESPYDPESYIEAIELAESLGYGIIIVDSASHEWIGKGGILEILDRMGSRATAWKELTPRHNKFVDKLLHSSSHLILTLRSKTEYDFSNEGGKLKVTKLGTKSQMRDGLDYEMTTVLKLNQENLATADKDRTKLFHGKSFVPSKETAQSFTTGWPVELRTCPQRMTSLSTEISLPPTLLIGRRKRGKQQRE
jgi:hypothetical protein